VVGIIIVVFGAYEVLERTWGADGGLLRALHAARGVSAGVAAACGAAWWLKRPAARRFPVPAFPTLPGSEELAEHLAWFVGLRWLAAGLATLAVFVSQHVLGLLPAEVTPPLWAGCAAIWLTNAAWARPGAPDADLRGRLRGMIAADLIILTFLLHFSGGLENPLLVLYAFHVIIAGIVLPARDSYKVAALAAALLLAMGFGEHLRLTPHYTLSLFPHETKRGEVLHASYELPFVLGRLGALLVLLAGAAYFATAVMERLRAGHRRLIQAERLAALGQLAADVAHELNNPIGIISTRMKLAGSGAAEYATPGFVRETLEIVDRQADRVARVVRSLLSLANPHPRPRSPVDVAAAAAEALDLLAARLRGSGIDVESRLAAGLPWAEARREDVLHILLNIMGNAADAMPEGGTLTLSGAAADGRVMVTVSDTGPGIPEGLRERVFEPFCTTKARESGTGLGLPLSLALARACGGDIRFECAPGAGTAFHVSLPAAEAP
jgi:signal transduction histidine kinase